MYGKGSASEMNLNSGLLSVPSGGSKFSLSNKLNDKQKKSKSGFSLFKKGKSNEQVTGSGRSGKKLQLQKYHTPDYSDEESLESDGPMGPEISIMPPRVPPEFGMNKSMKKTASEISYGSEGLDSEVMHLQANLQVIDEYYFGVRVFPGQDTNQIWIGWTTPGYHSYSTDFDLAKQVRSVTICTQTPDYRIKSA